MLSLSIIRPFLSFETISDVPLDTKGISEFKLAVVDKKPYLMTLTINPNLRDFYDIIKDNNDVGLRLRQTSDKTGEVFVDLAFVKDRTSEAQKNLANGAVQLVFKSSVAMLDIFDTRNLPYYLISQSQSAASLIERISPRFAFKLVGADQNINFLSGNFNNIELLEEITQGCKGWTWFERGVDPYSNQTIIEFGDFTSKQSVGRIEQYATDKILDESVILISGIPSQNLTGNPATHVLAIGSSSSGASADPSQSFFLRDPGARYIDLDYPLVNINNERDWENRLMYRIVNTPLLRELGYRVFSTNQEVFSSNANSFTNPEEASLFTNFDAERLLYNRTVNKMRQENFSYSYSNEYIYPRIFLPTDKLILNYKRSHTYFDKTREVINAEDETVFVKNVEYDLLKFIS